MPAPWPASSERSRAVIDRRGACRHPDGVVRAGPLRALTVFADDARDHAAGRPCPDDTAPTVLTFPVRSTPRVAHMSRPTPVRDPRLRVDPVACDAFGYCAELLPERVTLDEWGYPVVDGTPVDASLVDLATRAAPSARGGRCTWSGSDGRR